VVDDVPLHRVRRPKISNERNRGEGYAKRAAAPPSVNSMTYVWQN
jgi:hypothetical protein